MTVELPTRKIRHYGWKPDLPDHRDYIYNLKNVVLMPGQVPGESDLTPQMPPVYDQGQLGSCTGNGWAAVMEKALLEAGDSSGTPSRLFIYFNERVIEGTVSTDSGAEIRDGAKVVSTLGVPPETLWSYDISKFADKPPQEAFDAAIKHEALEYQRIIVGGPGAPMRTALSQGYPTVFGMPVPDYFESGSGWDPSTKPLPVPGANASIIGGHCMVVVGYDFTMRQFDVPAFKVRNSWGPSWGEAGHLWMDYRWFASNDSLASDMWIVKKAA